MITFAKIERFYVMAKGIGTIFLHMTSDNPYKEGTASPEAAASPVILTPAGFADTGQWRLLISVSDTGLGAVLRHVSDSARPAVKLFDERWTPLEGRELLDRLESCIYEHPSVLDDYATEIVVEPLVVTWVPSEILDRGDFTEEHIFHEVFNETEVMADKVGDATALYLLTEGFDGFISRTIPGARIRTDQGVLVERLRPSDGSDDEFVINVLKTGNQVHLVAFSGTTLFCCVTHYVGSDEEAYAMADAIGRRWSGERGYRIRTLRLPRRIADTGLPAAAALVLFKEVELEMVTDHKIEGCSGDNDLMQRL